MQIPKPKIAVDERGMAGILQGILTVGAGAVAIIFLVYLFASINVSLDNEVLYGQVSNETLEFTTGKAQTDYYPIVAGSYTLYNISAGTTLVEGVDYTLFTNNGTVVSVTLDPVNFTYTIDYKYEGGVAWDTMNNVETAGYGAFGLSGTLLYAVIGGVAIAVILRMFVLR